MALIIKAQMPKSCEWTDKTSRTGMGYCPLKDKCMAYREEVSKQYTINAHPIDYIPSDCPIIGEIPDSHGDLIDEDEFRQVIYREIRNHKKDEPITMILKGILLEMDNAPVIVEATE